MQKQNRKPCPAIEKLDEKTSDTKFRKMVKPCLLKMTENHCSYCDEHFWNEGNFFVEHFKYRIGYSELKREYSNLYLSCFSCNNRKRDSHYPEIEPIRPDDDDYEFDKYFYFEPDSGKLILLDENNEKAKATIEYLNLNNDDIVGARHSFVNAWASSGSRPCLSYRFIQILKKINYKKALKPTKSPKNSHVNLS